MNKIWKQLLYYCGIFLVIFLSDVVCSVFQEKAQSTYQLVYLLLDLGTGIAAFILVLLLVLGRTALCSIRPAENSVVCNVVCFFAAAGVLWWRFFYFGEVTFISLLLPVSELFHGLMTLLLMRKKKVQGNADTSIPSP